MKFINSCFICSLTLMLATSITGCEKEKEKPQGTIVRTINQSFSGARTTLNALRQTGIDIDENDIYDFILQIKLGEPDYWTINRAGFALSYSEVSISGNFENLDEHEVIRDTLLNQDFAKCGYIDLQKHTTEQIVNVHFSRSGKLHYGYIKFEGNTQLMDNTPGTADADNTVTDFIIKEIGWNTIPETPVEIQ